MRAPCYVDVPPDEGAAGGRALANAVRCAILDMVETRAIASVTFTRNDSVMSDEQVAHRLGMVTVTDDELGAALHLRCEAPDAERLCVDTTALTLEDGSPAPLADDEPTPIVMLGPGERLDAVAHTARASGHAHARYCPAEVVTYDPVPGGGTRVGVEPTGAVAGGAIFARAYDELEARLRACARAIGDG